MWVLKTHGKTYYVNHVECSIPWSTKETPDNPHTRGAIKVKNCLLTIDDDNNATISTLTAHDKIRLHNEAKGITRVVCGWNTKTALADIIKRNNVKHGPFKQVGGSCGSQYFVTDILDKQSLSMLVLSASDKFRILNPNEILYKAYDDPNHDPDWYWKGGIEDDDDSEDLGSD